MRVSQVEYQLHDESTVEQSFGSDSEEDQSHNEGTHEYYGRHLGDNVQGVTRPLSINSEKGRNPVLETVQFLVNTEKMERWEMDNVTDCVCRMSYNFFTYLFTYLLICSWVRRRVVSVCVTFC